MEEAGTHTAEITEFVPLKTVDPLYFDKAYYLGPDKGGAKPYALLARALRDIDIPKMDVKPQELKLAQQLIAQQSVDKFDPSAYKDDVRERIDAAIQKKVEGQEITLAEAPEPGGQVIDLMEALRASLEKKPAKRAPAAAPAQPAKPARKAAAKK